MSAKVPTVHQEKLTLEWGERQATRLWDTIFSNFDVEWSGKHVMDFGCLWGYLPKLFLEERGVEESYGVDKHPQWEEMSDDWDYEGTPNLHLHAGDLLSIAELQDKQFDIITSSGTIFLINPSKLERILVWMYEHLRPGVSLLIQTRTFFSGVGGDLHNVTSIPIPHIIFNKNITYEFARSLNREGIYSNYMSPMSSTAYLMLFHRAGFNILDVRSGKTDIDDEVYQRFNDNIWYYNVSDLTTSDIYVHLLRPEKERDISELRD